MSDETHVEQPGGRMTRDETTPTDDEVLARRYDLTPTELAWIKSRKLRQQRALEEAAAALATPAAAPPADLVALVRDLQEADAVLKQVASARAMRRWHEALNKVVAYALERTPAAPRVPDTPQGWKSVIDLVSDDAWAMTFQSLGQYRTALLKALRAGQATQEPQSVQPRGECPTCGGVWPCGRCTTRAVDLDALKARLKAAARAPTGADDAIAALRAPAVTSPHANALVEAQHRAERAEGRLREISDLLEDAGVPGGTTIYGGVMMLRERAERAESSLCAPAVTGAAPMTPTREQIQALVDKWRNELKDYPVSTDERAKFAAAAVRLCADELAAAIATQEAAPMPPIEVGDWVHEDGEKEAVIVRETHQAKSLNRGIRRSGVTEIRKANGTVWRRP